MKPPELDQLRFELKLPYEGLQAHIVRQWITLHPAMFSQAFPPRSVNNIYFDTQELDTFNDHLSGVAQRLKLRLRWYGPDHTVIQAGSLEVKGKIGRLGWKRSQEVNQTYHLDQQSIAATYAGLLAEIRDDFRLLLADARPTILNCYHREYYITADRRVRLTLDTGMSAYAQHLSAGWNLDRQLPFPEVVMVEIKAAAAEQARLPSLIDRFPLRATRSSKYLSAMEAALF